MSPILLGAQYHVHVGVTNARAVLNEPVAFFAEVVERGEVHDVPRALGDLFTECVTPPVA